MTDSTPATAPSNNVTCLERDGKTYYLVGTAHVSQKSVDEVSAVIDEVKPDSVCVELCETRYNAIVDEARWKNLNIFTIIKEGKTLMLLAHLAIGAYQRRLGEQLGIKPGAEMIAAMQKAKEHNAALVLADRDIQVTLKRTWANLSFWEKMNLLGAIVEGLFVGGQPIDEKEIERLKEKDHLSEMMNEFATALPKVKRPLIDERDQYLMASIEKAQGKKIVAVVGAGHVSGMTTHFGKPVDLDAISALPAPSKWTPILKWAIPLLIVLTFGYGYYKNQGRTLEDMIYAWVLPTSVMCGLFSALAGAKPLSILSGFLASPITTLHPLIGAGMVVGLVEAWLRKPTVEDCENINRDVRSVKGFYKNRFTRVLLVTMLSNVGASIGAMIGLSWLLSIVS